MRYFFFYFAMFSFFPQAVFSGEENFSLMFSEEEILQIRQERHKQPTMATLDEESLYLGAVMSLSPTGWTLWMNGKPLRHTDVHPDIQVQEITHGQVHLLWRFKEENHDVVMRPHQTYCPKLKKVIQGKGCESIARGKEIP